MRATTTIMRSLCRLLLVVVGLRAALTQHAFLPPALVHRPPRSVAVLPPQNNRIGGEGERGISGGERRRVTLCEELVTEPRFIALDEPTTGQDAGTAVRLVRILRALAQGGCTVVASVHQPSEVTRVVSTGRRSPKHHHTPSPLLVPPASCLLSCLLSCC